MEPMKIVGATNVIFWEPLGNDVLVGVLGVGEVKKKKGDFWITIFLGVPKVIKTTV